MTSAGKVGVGAAALGGSGGAIGYGVKYVLDKAPDHTLLSAITNLSTTYSDGTFGNVNKDSFVDPSQNEEWWKWAHVKRFNVEEAESKQFKKVEKAYSSNSDDKALNKVCETALKLEKKNLVKIAYKKDVWRYCSSSGVIDKDVENAPEATVLESGTENKLSGTGDNKEKLVKDSENEEWWNWVYENKLSIEKDKTSNGLSSEFNGVNKGYASGEDSNALNKVCKTSHSKSKSDLDGEDNKNKYKRNIETYCTKDGSTLDLPTT